MAEALSPLISLEEMALTTALCASCPATRSGEIPTDRWLVDSRKAPGVDRAGLKGNEGQIDRSVGSLTPLKLGEMVGFFAGVEREGQDSIALKLCCEGGREQTALPGCAERKV